MKLIKETGFRFLAETKYKNLSPSDQSLELPQPLLEEPCPQHFPRIDLPKPKSPSSPLGQIINQRKSRRIFQERAMSLEELSWLLWATAGVKEDKGIASLRTVPSAGARHPFDTYLAIDNVADLRKGIYRYLAFEHKLAFIEPDDNLNTRLMEACLRQKWLLSASVTFIWVAVPYRSAWRYSERSWRYMFLDAGHVCQNLYLAAEAINWGTCAVAAFDDDALNNLLHLDGNNQFAIYLAPVGHGK